MHVRACLNTIWDNRRAAMMLASGDVGRFRGLALLQNTLAFFLAGWSARRGLVQAGPSVAHVLIAIMSEASSMVTMCDRLPMSSRSVTPPSSGSHG